MVGRLLLAELGGTFPINAWFFYLPSIAKAEPPTHFLLQTTLLYFFVDLVWVATVPICVKSPGVIIKVGASRVEFSGAVVDPFLGISVNNSKCVPTLSL